MSWVPARPARSIMPTSRPRVAAARSSASWARVSGSGGMAIGGRAGGLAVDGAGAGGGGAGAGVSAGGGAGGWISGCGWVSAGAATGGSAWALLSLSPFSVSDRPDRLPWGGAAVWAAAATATSASAVAESRGARRMTGSSADQRGGVDPRAAGIKRASAGDGQALRRAAGFSRRSARSRN
jgi:hypothetical protein